MPNGYINRKCTDVQSVKRYSLFRFLGYGVATVSASLLLTGAVHAIELTPSVMGTSGNDAGLYVIATADNHYVGCGITDSVSGNYDVIAFKLKPDGTQVWQTTVLKANGQLDRCHGLVETEEGDLVLSGHTTSGGASRFATYVTRLDSSGNQKWFKTYFNQNKDYDTNYSIAESPNHDGFVVVGATTLYDAWADLSIRKISNDGDEEWSQIIRSPYYNVGEDIKSIPDGYIITGITGGDSSQESDGQVTKISLSGEVVWKQTVGINGVRDELFSSVIADHQIVYSTGFVTNSSGDQDIVLTARSLDDGMLLFQKTFGEVGINEFATRGSNIVLNPKTNTLFIVGISGSEGIVIESDLQGNLLNSSKYGGNSGKTYLRTITSNRTGDHMMAIGITNSAVFQSQQNDILLLTVKNSDTANPVTYGDSNASVVKVYQYVNGDLEYVTTMSVEEFDSLYKEHQDYRIVTEGTTNYDYVLEGINDAGETTTLTRVIRLQ